MRLTPEQARVRDSAPDAVSAGRNLRVIAFAGAGKTTTLVAVAESIHRRGCYLAFNRAIANEAKARFAHTDCRPSTMHALAFGAVRDRVQRPATLTAQDIRNSGILDRVRFPVPCSLRPWTTFRVARMVLRTLSAFCRSADREISRNHAEETIIETFGDPDRMWDSVKAEAVREMLFRLSRPLRDATRLLWENLMEESILPHDVYLKLIDLEEGLRSQAFRGFRYVMVDEAQDLNPVQMSILQQTGLPLVAVGDPYQQIYSWRGAENALDRITGDALYLTQSFRFGEDIARVARLILAARPDGGPRARLAGIGGRGSAERKPKRAVLCRTNVGVIEEAIRHLRKGHGVWADNAQQLCDEVRSADALMAGRPDDVVSPSLRGFTCWGQVRDAAEDGVVEAARLVKIIDDGLAGELIRLADQQAERPGPDDIVIQTAHRAKGLEYEQVLLGQDWPTLGEMRDRHETMAGISQRAVTMALEEWNALYVAATRAVQDLKGARRIVEESARPGATSFRAAAL